MYEQHKDEELERQGSMHRSRKPSQRELFQVMISIISYLLLSWTTIILVLDPKSSTNLCRILYGKLRNSPTVQHFQHFLGDL